MIAFSENIYYDRSMTSVSPLLLATFCTLISVHFVYFLLIQKMTNISMRASVLAIGGGCLVWYLVFLLALGPNASVNIDLVVADVQIEGKRFIEEQQAIAYQFLSSLSPWKGNQSLASVFMPALVEEAGKMLCLIGVFFLFQRSKIQGRIENTKTALGTMSVIALGFSLAENLQYTLSIMRDVSIDIQFFRFSLVRYIFLPLIHMSFALYGAYAFGKIHFLIWEMIDEHQIKKLRNMFHSRKRIRIYQLCIFLGGLTLSVALHTVYNFFLDSAMPLAALTVSFGILVVFFLFLLGDQNKNLYQSIIDKIQREQKLTVLKKRR